MAPFSNLIGGGGGGEANTASNIGIAGVGVFKQKTGVDLELKKINAGSSKVTVTDDVANNELDIDVAPSAIDHNALLNYVANQHINWTAASSNLVTSGTGEFANLLSIKGNATNAGRIKIYEDTDNGTNSVEIKAPAILAADYALTLPPDDGLVNQVLTTDGAGVLSWGAGGTGLNNIVEDLTPQLGGQLDVNTFALGDGTLELLKFVETASAVNELTVTNAATTGAPALSATGDDTNIALNLIPKGTSRVQAAGVTVPTISSTDTLTNKTLTAPIIATIVNTGTVTLPTATDTLVARATTDTLTNKTVDADLNTITNIENADIKAAAAIAISKLAARKGQIVAVFDGNGAVVVANSKLYIRCDYAATITKATVLADLTGSCVIDIWKDTYANYPPTVADTITAAAKPTLSSAIKAEDATLTGWTTAVTAGDTFVFNVDSATTVTKLTVILSTDKTS